MNEKDRKVDLLDVFPPDTDMKLPASKEGMDYLHSQINNNKREDSVNAQSEKLNYRLKEAEAQSRILNTMINASDSMKQPEDLTRNALEIDPQLNWIVRFGVWVNKKMK